MTNIKFDDVTLVYPFIQVSGLIGRNEKKKILERQKEMPFISNEGVVAVQHFSATLKNGEFVVIVGPSGSGKTSVLRMLAGLEKPSLGKIYFGSEVINKLKPEERDIAMVFQNYTLYPNQTVYDNIAFPLRNQHLPRHEVSEKVNEIIELLHLNGKELRYPDELSGGEKQRVAIGRALVRKPKVFLLDEPFSNLDELMKNSLRIEIKRIQKKLGITFIYVTHDQKDALLLADRIIVMKDGIIQQNDIVSNVYNYPTNLFCANFVGFPKMNVFENIIVKNGTFELFGQHYKLHNKKIKNDDKIIVGVRPFNISITTQGINAIIDYSEIDGSDLIVHACIDEQEIIIVEKNLNQEGLKYFNKQEVKLTFDENYFYIFNEFEEGIY